MSKKGIIGIIVAVLVVIAGLGACIYRDDFQRSAAPAKQTKSTQTETKNDQKRSGYTQNDWLVMGYMAYARHNYEESRDAQTTSDLVQDVKEDVNDGALKIVKDGSMYTLTNKFGSVQGEVTGDQIKITGDNDHTFTKSDLKNSFAGYRGDIRIIAQGIEKGSGNAQSAIGTKNSRKGKEGPSDSDADYSDQEVVTMALITWMKKSPAENVQETMKRINNPKQGTVYSGISHDKNGYEIAFNPSTSDYAIFTVSGDQVTSRPAGANLGANPHGRRRVYSKKELIQQYGFYKDQIDHMIAKMKENSKHLQDFQ